ncbi:protein GUCD1 isoform X2 [Cydia fagiglandana]|uniref:protein GUCD1 isoform X1 n=1 Tax=Cydia fagiglandana TaxID=1458189 RepID=UPI002FEDF771
MGSAAENVYGEHQLEHFTQRYSWDCGVACVTMLLDPAQRQELLDNFEQICKEEGFGQITWTIDLCYLLKKFEIPHCMHTTMMGVNEAHRKHNYYRNIIDKDRLRISQRFDSANAVGIELVEGHLPMDAIVRHLRHGPALLLIDAGLLSCDICKHNKLKADFRRCFGGSFTGHFVLLVGVRRNKLLYRDPALRPRTCATSMARMERARAPPTDRDVILVYKEYRR